MNTEIQNYRPDWLRFLAFALSVCFLIVASTPADAQEEGTASQIIITKSDAKIHVGELPAFELHLYGFDEVGNAVDLTSKSFKVLHNGEEISEGDVHVGGPLEEGTSTLFFVDVPQGVAAQIPAVQEALRQFASDPHTLEAFDNLAIYRVGEFAAKEIVPMTNSHATVQDSLIEPFAPNKDATALLDSVGRLFLENLNNLQIPPEAVVHVVVVGDGSDLISSQYDREAILEKVAEKGIQIHTIALDNPDLTNMQKEQGREFLAQLAEATNGLAIVQPSAFGDLLPLWERIAAFRNRTVLKYTLADVTEGTYKVEVILQQNPEIKTETDVGVPTPPLSPRVVINLPQGDRNLKVPDLDGPLMLSFSAIVTWPDGNWRDIVKAELIVDGETAEELDANGLDYFEIGIDKFRFGDNELEIDLEDGDGGRGKSPVIVLKIEQGDQDIPDPLKPIAPPEPPEETGIWQQFQDSAVPLASGFVVGSWLILLLIGIVFALYQLARSQRSDEPQQSDE
jgi:hypothetical protein